MYEASPASPEAPDLCPVGHRDAKNEVPDTGVPGGSYLRRGHQMPQVTQRQHGKPLPVFSRGRGPKASQRSSLRDPQPCASSCLALCSSASHGSGGLCAWGDACCIGLFIPKTQPGSLGFHPVCPQRPRATLLGLLVGIWGCAGSSAVRVTGLWWCKAGVGTSVPRIPVLSGQPPEPSSPSPPPAGQPRLGPLQFSSFCPGVPTQIQAYLDLDPRP